jgi:protein-L-isoaspartate(D-aspartate) O-methyltransferase
MLNRLVDQLVETGAIRTEAVERAFRSVQRHRFLDRFMMYTDDGLQQVPYTPDDPAPEHLSTIYSDVALATRISEGEPTSSTSEPSLMAAMLESLRLSPGMSVLEIGAGIGYNAALMAELVGIEGLVVSLELDGELAAETSRRLADAGYRRVHVEHRDGCGGAPEHAPYDRVIATVGCPDVCPAWVQQLGEDGNVLVPLEHAGVHPLLRARRRGDRLVGEFLSWTGFLPMRGQVEQHSRWVRANDLERDVGPEREQQPWGGFGSADNIPGWDVPGDEMDFLFFLALTDPRAHVFPNGVGLWEGFGHWAVAGRGRKIWSGPRSIVQELNSLFGRWDEAHRPRLTDYNVEVRFGSPSADDSEKGFVVDRKFCVELVSLRR